MLTPRYMVPHQHHLLSPWSSVLVPQWLALHPFLHAGNIIIISPYITITHLTSNPQRGFTTIRDRATLHVHRDGARVAALESRYMTWDPRGNQIAADAKGAGNAKKHERAAISDGEVEPQADTRRFQCLLPPDSTDSCVGEVEGESERDDRKHKNQEKDSQTITPTQFYQDIADPDSSSPVVSCR